LVTHGESEKDIPNPGLTEEGKKQMKQIKLQIPREFSLVVCGKGRRHQQSCKIVSDKEPDFSSEVVGVKETLSSDRSHMIFPDGHKVDMRDYMKEAQELLRRVQPFLKQLFSRAKDPGDILIVGGRIVAVGLGLGSEKVKPGQIFQITMADAGRIRISDYQKAN